MTKEDEEEMNTTIHIRAATELDVDTIVALNHGLFQEDAGQRDSSMDLDWPLRSGHEYFAALLERDEVCCLLAEDTDRADHADHAVGYLIGYLRKTSTLRPIKLAELESMFVVAEARSAGVGATLVSRFKQWCNEHGVERISVTAYAANDRAIAFYRNHGFDLRNVILEAALPEEEEKVAQDPRRAASFPARVATELATAKSDHASMNSLHEGYAVLLEEVDELWDEIKAKVRNRERLEDETVQIAAMCQRLYEDVIQNL